MTSRMFRERIHGETFGAILVTSRLTLNKIRKLSSVVVVVVVVDSEHGLEFTFLFTRAITSVLVAVAVVIVGGGFRKGTN